MNQTLSRGGWEKIWLWAGSINTFLQILWNTGMDRKGNIVVVFFFFKMVLNTGSYSQEHPNVSDYRIIQKSYFHKKDLLSELKKINEKCN